MLQYFLAVGTFTIMQSPL
uniref:Uncharacterized protein n=1 Tax=Anguilla anguilla TaxID=7936 RepID=A0A0E9T9N7_ANGAN